MVPGIFKVFLCIAVTGQQLIDEYIAVSAGLFVLFIVGQYVWMFDELVVCGRRVQNNAKVFFLCKGSKHEQEG